MFLCNFITGTNFEKLYLPARVSLHSPLMGLQVIHSELQALLQSAPHLPIPHPIKLNCIIVI
jgi:hypothetical protein